MVLPRWSPWVHQIIEYVVGIALGLMATHSHHPVVLGAMAVVVVINASCVRGPLSAFRRVSPRVHTIVDVCIVVMGLSFTVVGGLDVAGRTAMLATAVAVGFVSVRFPHDVRTPRS